MILDNNPGYEALYIVVAVTEDRSATTGSHGWGWPPAIQVIRTKATRPDPPMKVFRVEDETFKHNIRHLAIIAAREAKNTRPRERAPTVWALKAARRQRAAGAMLGQRARRHGHRGPSAAPRFSGEDALNV